MSKKNSQFGTSIPVALPQHLLNNHSITFIAKKEQTLWPQAQGLG